MSIVILFDVAKMSYYFQEKSKNIFVQPECTKFEATNVKADCGEYRRDKEYVINQALDAWVKSPGHICYCTAICKTTIRQSIAEQQEKYCEQILPMRVRCG